MTDFTLDLVRVVNCVISAAGNVTVRRTLTGNPDYAFVQFSTYNIMASDPKNTSADVNCNVSTVLDHSRPREYLWGKPTVFIKSRLDDVFSVHVTCAITSSFWAIYLA